MGYSLKKLTEKHRAFFLNEETRSVDARILILKKMKKLIKKWEKPLLKAMQEDLGKPGMEAYVSEIYFTIKEIDFALKNIKKWAAAEKAKGELFLFPSKSRIFYEPYGVVLIIGPWNYPFQLVTAPLVSAVAAGNCAIVKPSEISSAVSGVLNRMFSEAFDDEWISIVEGGVETATELLSQDFDLIFYTGNGRVGKIVMKAAADNLTPVVLELGGKSPCIVDKEIDLQKAVKKITLGKFFNAGQTCVAPDYIYVHSEIRDKFFGLLEKCIKEFYGNNPASSPDYAQIINRRHFDRLTALIDEKAVTIGEHDQNTLKVAPTLLPQADWNHAAMKEEIFGPVLPILEYNDLDVVIQKLASQPKPLALYLFSNNDQLQNKIVRKTSSGGICINDVMMHITNMHLPFGGVGDSGMGRYRGKYGFLTFSNQKSVMVKSQKWDIFSAYPPYGKKLKILRKILR